MLSIAITILVWIGGAILAVYLLAVGGMVLAGYVAAFKGFFEGLLGIRPKG